MRRPTLVRSVVVTAAVALLAGGCGGGATNTSSKDPKTAFGVGRDGLNDAEALTVTLKLDTTPETLIALAKATGDPLVPTTAQALAGGQLVFENKTTNGKKLSEIKSGDANATAGRVSFAENGTSYVEFRTRDSNLYLRADVKGLLGVVGKSKQYDELQARANTLPAFVKALVAGQWVSLPSSVLTALASQFGGSGALPSAAQMKKLISDVNAVIDRDVAVTRVGSDDQGDHLTLTVQSRQFVTDALQAISGAVPAAGLALAKVNPTEVPQRSVVLDAWINDGALSKLSIDIAQFFDDKLKAVAAHLPVVLTFDRSGDDIEKPDGATQIDLTQLGALLGGLGA